MTKYRDMAGHSRWAQIKREKSAHDKKRSETHSKLISAIASAALANPHPEWNPRLRAAIEKARAARVSDETIAAALGRARGRGPLEDVLIEAYSPGGVGMLITGTTENASRLIAEIRRLLAGYDAKLAETGSVRWAFEEVGADGAKAWRPKFPQSLPTADHEKLARLTEALRARKDVQGVWTAEEGVP